MAKKNPRLDQEAAIDNLREAMRETRRAVMQGPTGFGKTVVMASICESARAKDKRIIVTVPALSLIDQTVQAFYEQGIEDVGVIQAGHHMTNASKPVQVCSVQTLVSRGIENLSADIVLVDEVHKWFKLFERWFAEERWRRVPIIGFSATPWTVGLGMWFDKLVVANTIEGMIEAGTLAPFRVFAGSHPDLDGVRINRGEYVQEDLAERVNKPKLVADIVESWRELGQGRPTVAFCVSRSHADQVAKEFNEAGIPSGYMDCETPVLDREAIRRRFLAGDIKVVCNVDVIGLGVDWPELSCISYCRPTRSFMRWVQNIGRGLRLSSDKSDLIVIDHSDTTRRLGFVTDIAFPGLDDGKTHAKQEVGVALPKECAACHYMKPPRVAKCPSCGFEMAAHAKPVLVERGTLREIKPVDSSKKKSEAGARFPNRAETYAMLLGYARNHGKKDGMAFFKYRALYGNDPPGNWSPRTTNPLQPSVDLMQWIKSQNIAFAKAKTRWNEAASTNGNGNGHANGNGHDHGALSGREQAIIDRVAEQAKGSLMTSEDWKDMEDFR